MQASAGDQGFLLSDTGALAHPSRPAGLGEMSIDETARMRTYSALHLHAGIILDMCAAIRIDPATGRKLFRTRAAKASDRIAGKGYSIVADATLTTLPPPPPGATFNAEEQRRYREFKEAREGAADYMAMEGEFARYLEDVYSEPPIPREALTDACEILVIGAGFGAMLLWYRLMQAGFTDVRFCEKGGDARRPLHQSRRALTVGYQGAAAIALG